jgi:hypothetical protein
VYLHFAYVHYKSVSRIALSLVTRLRCWTTVVQLVERAGFLDAFTTKLQKLPHCFDMSFCPSATIREPLNWFPLNLIFGIVLKFVYTFKFWLKSDNNGHFARWFTCDSARGSGLKNCVGDPQAPETPPTQPRWGIHMRVLRDDIKQLYLHAIMTWCLRHTQLGIWPQGLAFGHDISCDNKYETKARASSVIVLPTWGTR